MKLIKGNFFSDDRGQIKFVNDFDMTQVVRMYSIEPKLGVIRAWQGHKMETKWFYVVKGSFLVKVVAMDSLEKTEYSLCSSVSEVLEIVPGHYNGFEALEDGSVLMVFSDFGLAESKEDDYRESLENIGWG